MSNIVNHVKEIAELIKKYQDQDLYERIVNLREEILELREQNLSYKDEIRKFKKANDIEALLIREGNCYYLNDDEDRKKPYCLTCWDADRKLVSLITHPYQSDPSNFYIKCGICEARVKE